MKNIKRYNAIMSFIFMCMITLPILFTNKVGGGISVQENRYLARFPQLFNEEGKLITDGLLTGFESWINDNIFGREVALKINGWIDYKIFKKHPASNTRLGKDKWIYLMDDNTIKKIQNNDIPDRETVNKLDSKMKDITQYFKRNGIIFAMNVFPFKPDIYPEYLPDGIMKVRDKSFLDIYADLSHTDEYDLNIDVDEFIKAKQNTVIYSKAHDTSHWNNYGAYIGYIQIMQGIKKHIPDIKMLEKEDFIITPFEREITIAGELHTTETDYDFQLKTQRTAVSDKSFFDRIGFTSNDPWRSYNYYKNSDERLPKAVIVGDSYTWMFMLDNLAESFSELVFLHYYDINNTDMICDIIDADIVVLAGLTETVYTGVNIFQIIDEDSITTVKKTNQPYQYLDFVNGEILGSTNNITVSNNISHIELEGWAVDCLANDTASKVMVQVGNEYYEANYGKPRESVVIYFQNDGWLNSGYTITLNAKEVIEAGKISIHVISQDGSYQYPPVRYTITQE